MDEEKATGYYCTYCQGYISYIDVEVKEITALLPPHHVEVLIVAHCPLCFTSQGDGVQVVVRVNRGKEERGNGN